jgi:hypothetical protein
MRTMPQAAEGRRELTDVGAKQSSPFGFDKSRSPLASKRIPCTPDSAVVLCDGAEQADYTSDVRPTAAGSGMFPSASNEQFAAVDTSDTSDSGKSSDAAVSSGLQMYDRWKSEIPTQSSPDLASDGDADSKESGYITLEDLRAKIGDSGARSSWGSDERGVNGACSQATDQDVGGFSSGDERRPDMLATRRSAAARLPALACFDGIVSSACRGFNISGGGGVVPLMSPLDAFDCCGGVDDRLTPTGSSTFFECRSAPPTCDSSLLRFTFTVRLDSKMFRRRMMQSASRQCSPTAVSAVAVEDDNRPPTLTLLADLGRQSPDNRLPLSLGRPPSLISGRVDVVVEDAAIVFGRAVECQPVSAVMSTVTQTLAQSSTLSRSQQLAIGPSPDFDDGDGPPPPLPSESANVSGFTKALAADTQPDIGSVADVAPIADTQVSPERSPFVGEKVVVQAEVHRSADQLDTETISSKTGQSRKIVSCPAKNVPASKATTSNRKNGAECQIRHLIDSSSHSATMVATSNGHRQQQHCADAAMWNSFQGCIRHVDVDRIVELSSAPSAPHDAKHHVQQRSSDSDAPRGRSCSSSFQADERLALTMRKPVKKTSAVAAATLHRDDSRTKSQVCRNGEFNRAAAAASEVHGRREGSQSRRCNENRMKERRARRRAGSADSSSMSSDGAIGYESDNELCSPCIHSAATTTVAKTSCCNHHHAVRADRQRSSAVASNGDTGANGGSNRKQMRRTLRQFFRVENLFACRLPHGTGGRGQHVSEAEAADVRHRGGRELNAHAGGWCATPMDTMMCRSATGCSSGGSRWLTNGSRSVQRSAAGRSPSTSAIERHSRHRSSRRAANGAQQLQQSKAARKAAAGTSRSVSPPGVRHGSRSRSKRTEIRQADADNDDERTAAEAVTATRSRHCPRPCDVEATRCHGCQFHACGGGQSTGNGSTMPADRRKVHRHHHQSGDLVDGAATMSSAMGGGHRGQWTTVCSATVDGSRCVADEGQTSAKFRQYRATPAVTPVSPSTPADDVILSPTGTDAFNYCSNRPTCT